MKIEDWLLVISYWRSEINLKMLTMTTKTIFYTSS